MNIEYVAHVPKLTRLLMPELAEAELGLLTLMLPFLNQLASGDVKLPYKFQRSGDSPIESLTLFQNESGLARLIGVGLTTEYIGSGKIARAVRNYSLAGFKADGENKVWVAEVGTNYARPSELTGYVRQRRQGRVDTIVTLQDMLTFVAQTSAS